MSSNTSGKRQRVPHRSPQPELIESGYRWWLKNVVIPLLSVLLGGGGLILLVKAPPQVVPVYDLQIIPTLSQAITPSAQPIAGIEQTSPTTVQPLPAPEQIIPVSSLPTADPNSSADQIEEKFDFSFTISKVVKNDTENTVTIHPENLPPYGRFTVLMAPSDIEMVNWFWVGTISSSDNEQQSKSYNYQIPERLQIFNKISIRVEGHIFDVKNLVTKGYFVERAFSNLSSDVVVIPATGPTSASDVVIPMTGVEPTPTIKATPQYQTYVEYVQNPQYQQIIAIGILSIILSVLIFLFRFVITPKS